MENKSQLPNLFLCGLLIGCPSLVLGAGYGQASIEELEPFTITTTTLPRSLFETPESIAVVSGETAEARGLESIQDVLPQTAGVYTLAGEAFGIRGIAHNSASTRGGTGEMASYYVDGVALTGFSKRFGPDDLWDVGQVEVLRGPQSTNVGRNALAGAIALKTRNPVFGSDSALRLRIADFNTFTYSGMLNTAVAEKSAVRLAVNHMTSDGYVTNPTRKETDYDGRRDTTIRGKWRWESEDRRWSVQAGLQYAETRRGEDFIPIRYRNDAGDLVRLDPAGRANLANLEAFENTNAWNAVVDLRFRLNDAWEITSLSSFLTSDYSRFDDDDQLPRGEDAFRGREATDENISEELRLKYYPGAKLNGVLGVFFTEVDLVNNTDSLINIDPSQVGVPAPLLPFYPELLNVGAPSFVDNQTRNLAFYTEWEYEISPDWAVFGGLRYDRESLDSRSQGERTLLNALPDPSAPGLPPQVAAGIAQVNAAVRGLLISSSDTANTDYDAWIPQAGLRYEGLKNTALGLMINQGYRAGGVELNAVGIRTEYAPETLTNVEASVRMRALDGRLRLNGNLYYGFWEDQQVGVQVNENNTVDVRTFNAGESEIYGFELEVAAVYPDPFTWFANLGHSHTEFLKFESTEGDFSGNRFGFAPTWTFAAGGTWQFHPNFHIHGNLNYLGDRYTDPANQFELDSRTVVNLRIGARFGNLRAALFADNLFDELYLENLTSNFDPDTILAKVGAPRVIGIQLQYDY